MNNNKKIYYYLIFMVFFLVAADVFLVNKLSLYGKKLQIIEEEIIQIEEKNNLLKQEIASLGSLTRLSSLAEEKGYIKNPPVIYLTGKIPVAAFYK